MLKDLVYKCRSYRRFYENIRISEEELKDLVDLARMTASTANSQALKYHLVTRPEECAAVFGTGMVRRRENALLLISLCFAIIPLGKISRPMWESLPRR